MFSCLPPGSCFRKAADVHSHSGYKMTTFSTNSSGDRQAIILCVDDEENPLTLRKLVLQRAGYSIMTANSGAQALEILRSNRIDLVVSDLLMPGMTGAELAREVKSLYPRIPM